MACTNLLTKALTNDCSARPAGGLQVKAWAINRSEIGSVTQIGLAVSAITMIATKVAFPITVSKKEMNAGYDAVVSNTFPDTFNQYFSFQPWQKTAVDIEALKNMNDIVIIVETEGAKEEGRFEIYGLENGLWKSSASKRANDNRGVATFEFTSRAGAEESAPNYVFWDTDYATTLAALVALES